MNEWHEGLENKWHKGLDNNTKGLKTHYLGFGFTLGIRRNCRLLMKSTKVQTHGELLMHGTAN